ncbi:TIGR02444 family protein [Salinispirillum sp. LH 10-3-1]|uniref:TIGR02444 family protein n=1 Tax=Salinispirillum sp. LH 10-3-1 TaxID=2952525 RepID=A0AB38YGH7_9GAMM
MASEYLLNNAALHHPLWSFSLALYARPGVAAHLLARQEEYHVWINDWLLSTWLAQQNQTLCSDFKSRIASWQEWREANVLVWRAMRQGLDKQQSPDAYRKASAIELKLEQLDQAYLYQHHRRLAERSALNPKRCLQLSLQKLSECPERALLSTSELLLSEARELPLS